MRKMIEGSRAVAEAVTLCRPGVISAYPITPQTHIVEELSQIVADGDLDAEYVRVESEHSAASVCLGLHPTGRSPRGFLRRSCLSSGAGTPRPGRDGPSKRVEAQPTRRREPRDPDR